MNLNEAVGVIRQVCAEFNGNLGDHQKIQQALQVVTEASLAPPLPPTEEKEEKPIKESDGNKK